MVDGQVKGEIDDRRRPSESFVPVAKPRKASPQLALQFNVRQQPNEVVNEVRGAVARWRAQGYPHTTATTRDLLAHWQAEDRERRLFFCQIEAAETAIYLTEAAEKSADTFALNEIRRLVRHAYFTGADDPYGKLRRALRADISDEVWATVNSNISRPFPRPSTGKVAVKVINHYGDEVMKVFAV